MEEFPTPQSCLSVILYVFPITEVRYCF